MSVENVPEICAQIYVVQLRGIAEFAGLEFAGLENDGLENDGLDVSKQQARLTEVDDGDE